MGSVTPYDTSAGRRYRVRYRKPGGAQTDKRGFTTKRDAQLFLATMEVKKATGDYIDPTKARVTIQDLAPAWLAKKEASLKPSALAPILSTWRVYVEPRWSSTPIAAIMPSEVERWIIEIQAGTAVNAGRRQIAPGTRRSPTVVIRAVGILAGILDDAVRDGRLSKNPARGADNLPRKQPKSERNYLSHDQVAQLVSAIDDDTKAALVLVLAYTGMRWGEAIALRVRDVNMLRRRLNIHRSATQVDGKIIVGTTKSWETRSVAFSAFLADVLADRARGKGPDGLLFEGKAGGYLPRPHTRENRPSWFSRALADAGLRYMTPHDLRHTAASLAVSAGANVKALQRMLGHKSAAMTLDTYADLFDDDLDQVATSLNNAASDTDVGKLWARRQSAG
jgi:integrase